MSQDVTPRRQTPGMDQRRQKRRQAVTLRSDERYAEILRAGARVFRERGYADTTLRDVADAVGISRSTLYYYIGTKEDLLAEILEDPLIEMTRGIRALADLDVPASERLRRAILLQMETFAEYFPEMFVFLAERLHVGRRTDRIRSNAREYGEALASIIDAGQRAGEFRQDVDPRVAMLGILGMSNWTHRWFRSGGRLTLPQIGEQFAGLALQGLLQDPGEDMDGC